MSWLLMFQIVDRGAPSHHWCGRRVMCDECARWWDAYYAMHDIISNLDLGGIADAYRPEGVP